MFKVGFRTGLLQDETRRDWSGNGPRPLRWAAWYPAPADAQVGMMELPPQRPLFLMGVVAPDAALAEAAAPFPVVLLSHGTGGSAASLGWLAGALASAGHVVIGVDHHGNTSSERHRAEGFLCWWERPRDLSCALDLLVAREPFAGRLDLGRVTAAGFSLGGYSVVALLGAITRMDLFRDFATARGFGDGPREFPDLARRVAPLLEGSAVFRTSWERQSTSCRDARVKAVLALAPAPTVRAFTLESLRAIERPVALAVGDADREAPAHDCAHWLHQHLPNATLERLGTDIGHYVLLAEGTALGKEREPDIWCDPHGVDRRAVQARVSALALHALAPGA
ncbi:dienelactone hydrolase [Ancylobacter sp. A5.8]|uniref:alpha/beta hydrolase family protein n=1 Tax=Ancylobacter gelatini TaxID=2919920 RepID=UPI001F4F0C63|nr:dienelactone hydrolase [Ancylobacter gelatini]MCJ8142457.1 dienelactone hydrolase [Ancylobacter gelatini]